MNNTTGSSSGTGTAGPSNTPEFTLENDKQASTKNSFKIQSESVLSYIGKIDTTNTHICDRK
jgi:hypothetical protein